MLASAQVLSLGYPRGSPQDMAFSGTSEQIGLVDLEPALVTHSGCQTFADALNRIETHEQLLRILSRFVQFNSIFGSGVANLAAEFGSKQNLFRDSKEEIVVFADRSVEVAADIFFAAIDEFGATAKKAGRTHRTLAQATVKGAGEFFGCSEGELNALSSPNRGTLEAIQRVRDGYGLDRRLTERDLFQGLGFHLGSERLADEEFRLLDRFLVTKYQALVDYLRNTEVTMNHLRCNPYLWIDIHLTVEADHFEAGLESANRAFQYYVGNAGQSQIKRWIIEGFTTFSAVQTEFMRNLQLD
jgi:hypothetical protein